MTFNSILEDLARATRPDLSQSLKMLVKTEQSKVSRRERFGTKGLTEGLIRKAVQEGVKGTPVLLPSRLVHAKGLVDQVIEVLSATPTTPVEEAPIPDKTPAPVVTIPPFAFPLDLLSRVILKEKGTLIISNEGKSGVRATITRGAKGVLSGKGSTVEAALSEVSKLLGV